VLWYYETNALLRGI